MDSSPTQTLQLLVVTIIDWIEYIDSIERCEDFQWIAFCSQEKIEKINFPFSRSDLKILRDHASILDSRSFMERKRSHIPDSYASLHLSEGWQKRFKFRNFSQVNRWMVFFLQDLQEVFKVPKLNHPRIVLVPRFMDFVLQFLIRNRQLFAFHPNLVINELRSFITIFSDSPFQVTEDERVHTLLSQFETLANESGRLIHSFLFSLDPPPLKKIDELLLEPISLLKDNVISFLNSPSYMNPPNTLYCAAMSSVFIVDSFLYDLENIMNREDDSIVEVKDLVEMLHGSLKQSWSLLKKHSDQTDDVKEIVLLAFDAEYLINYFLCGDAAAWYLALRLPGIIHSVELVGTRLQETRREYHDVGKVFEDAANFDARLSLQTGINSGVDDTMVGYKDEELKILNDLVGVGDGLKIISIIGMGGLGKTTMAKRLYNHPSVRCRFDRFSWCIVSQTYKKKELLVDILVGLESRIEKAAIEEMDDYQMGERIYKTLIGRRYFIVVDDIWKFSAWEDIKKYFPDDGNGSRILFTSRNKEVAQCNSTIHALPILSNYECWELLKEKVFHGKSCPLELQHIGEKIAAKCSGLPLIVIVVAGILSTMKELSAWENVRLTLDSYILSYQGSAVRKSLELSYIHLPKHLKPCFLYFGRFQEGEQFLVEKVMRLWIAEGFIPMDEKKRAEDTAKEYLKELIDKNLVLVAKTNYDGQAKVCTMHDLLRDMCLKIAEEDNFLKLVEGDYSMWNHKLQRSICNSSSKYLQPCGVHIRSFCSTRGLSNLNVCHMKVLRALDAEYLRLVDVQNLVHLRYLAVGILRGPMGRFSNLEFLIISYPPICISSSLLDTMTKLRYFKSYKVYVSNDCNNSRTYNLEYLSKVLIFQGKEVEQHLKPFPLLRSLNCCFEFLEEYGACFHTLPELERLNIFGVSEGYNFDFSFLTQLESLTFFGHNAIFEIKLPLNITKLHLEECVLSCESTRIIGALPNLEVLKLRDMGFEEGKWETKDHEFQKLKYLKLERVSKLVEWNVSSSEHFPLLQQLIISYCSALEEIPSEIGDISTLQLISVSGCSQSVHESLKQIQGQLEEYGNEDNVTIVVEDDDDYDHEDEDDEEEEEVVVKLHDTV